MGTIIPKPTFVDADNPTPDETAADNLYKARAQVVRNTLSPDLVVRFTAKQIPNDIIFEEGSLRVDEAKVMSAADMTVAEVQALTAGSAELESLVYAVELRRVIRFIPQAAQMIRDGLLGNTQQFQEIDWTERVKRLETDYQDAVKIVNPSATFTVTGSLGTPIVDSTKSRLPVYR